MKRGVVSNRSNALKLSIVILISIFSVFVVAILVTTFVVATSLVFRENKIPQKVNSHRYQYLQRDILRNETSVGIVSLGKKLKVDEFISYQSEDGTLNMISNFGTNEYMCSGSCFCDNSRRASAVIVRTITYLVAALSSIIAYDKAQDHFRESCIVSQEKSSCPSNAITSVVESCLSLESSSSSAAPDYSDDYVDPITKRKYYLADLKTYWCEGCCVPKNFTKEELRDKSGDYGCSGLCRSGEITVDIADVPSKDHNANARAAFQRDELTDFCKEESQINVHYTYPGNRGNKISTVNLCAAGKTRLNFSLYCRNMDAGNLDKERRRYNVDNEDE